MVDDSEIAEAVRDAVYAAMEKADISAISWFPRNNAPVADDSEGWDGGRC